MARLVEQLVLDDQEYCPHYVPDAGLKHAEARDRKLGGSPIGRRRLIIPLLERALSIDTTARDPSHRIVREELIRRALREAKVGRSERHPKVKEYTRRLARRVENPEMKEELEGFFEADWASVMISLRNVPERILLASGQTRLLPRDPFMARFFDHGGSGLKQLARHLTGRVVTTGMDVYFAARPVTLDGKDFEHPRPNHQMRMLKYPAQVRAEGLTNFDVASVYKGVNRRKDARIELARVDLRGEPIMSLSYMPHDLRQEFQPVLTPAEFATIAKQARSFVPIQDKGLHPPKGELIISWRQNGAVKFTPGDFHSLWLIDRILQQRRLRHPDFIPATSQR